MLKIVIPECDGWNEQLQEFVSMKSQTLCLEHSLVSLSKWEAKWKKPFLTKEPMTNAQIIDYIKCMTITQNVDPAVYLFLTEDNIKSVSDYIEDKMSATWFNDDKQCSQKEVITSELIYYWMIALNIPFECQKWHLNRLLTLIRICNIKQEKPKKMGKTATLKNNASLNAMRRQQFNSKG